MKKTYLLLISTLVFILSFAQAEKKIFTPIIFVHGMLASGDTWSLQFQRFEQQGYPIQLLEVVDWNTVSFGSRNTSLDSIINKTLALTGAKQVNLVGHSAGGGICYNYLSKSENAAKVAHYVHVGSGKLKQPASVPTMNIYSLDDKISGGEDLEGATNIALVGKDHYQVATSEETFKAMFQFFNNKEPKALNNNKPKEFIIGGKVVTFGENKPEIAASIEVYTIDAVNGKRKSAKPVYETQSDSSGKWNGFIAKPYEYYEFLVKPADTKKRPVHYYREPFTANNHLVYLRTLTNVGMAGMITQKLPSNDTQTVLALFSANKAVINGIDSLSVNGFDLSNKLFATAERTSIAYFLYDDGDNKTSGNKHQGMGMLPFMNMIDVFIPAEKEKLQLYFNGRKMNLPALPSAKDGIMVAVFD